MKTYLKDLTPEEIIRRLKNGEVAKIENRKNFYKMIDGVLCYVGESGFIINDVILIGEYNEYFETEEPLIFEQGKFYKTREGKKAYISRITATYIYGIVTEKTSSEIWKLDGTHWNKEEPHKNDLISKWED
jgi:hypothetical protein